MPSAVSSARIVFVRTEEETRNLAARLGRRARSGDLVCLLGPLGSGKTTFAQGFARGAGFKGAVTSPSFGLLREYRTRRLVIRHLDLFRLDARDLPNLGLEEHLEDPRSACLIEWPELARRLLPADRLEVRLRRSKGGGRRLALRALGPRSRELLGGQPLAQGR